MENVFKIKSIQKEEAAKLFYTYFISPKISSHLKGSILISATIKYIAKWILTTSDLSNKQTEFAFFALVLYDFLFMLETETTEEFFLIIGNILDHKNLSLQYKSLFLMRIRQSNNFNDFRVVPRKGSSRVEFKVQLDSWINQM